MSVFRALGRRSRMLLIQCKSSALSSPSQQLLNHVSPLLQNLSRSYGTSSTKVSVLQRLLYSGLSSQRFEFSSSASPENSEKESGESVHDQDNNTAVKAEDGGAAEEMQGTGHSSESQSTYESVKRRRRGTKRTAFSDSDSEQDIDDFTKEDLWKIANEKQQQLNQAQKEVAASKDTVLRAYAEMENVRERMKREAESAKKFAIQNFAKSLLDVADNLGRASSVAQESFSKIDTSKDTAGAVPLLRTLLEGVAMTEKQLAEVFRKYGMEKHDPTNEPFDPNLHNAIFQVPDNSKPPNTVAVVLKPGYTLHDRIIRPAEVGVTQAVESGDSNQGSEA